MKKRKIIRKRKPRVRRERDPIPWKYCVLTLICGLFLVSGFFLAATLHFSAIEYGMKNSKLRRQAEELRSEKRRLLLAREYSLAPSGIKKAGRKIGLRDLTPSSIEIVSRRKPIDTGLIAKQNSTLEDSIRAFRATTEKTDVNYSQVRIADRKRSKRRVTGHGIEKRSDKKRTDKIIEYMTERERRSSAKARLR